MVTSRNTSSGTCYEHVYNILEEIFESCVTEADTSELIANLNDIYDSFNGQGFEESFEKILLYVLSESKRNADVTKILRFISESVITFDNKYKTAATKEGTTVEDIDDVVHPLLKYLYKTLYRWSHSSNYTVRFRCCQLLFMILTYIQDHGMGEIDMNTYERIAKLIESRRLDVSSNVRAHAVLLAKFFQDPTVVNDPVIDGLCWQLQHDPNYRVRQNVVSIIAACEETVLPIANRFLCDKNPCVRNAALLHICKRISPRSFTTYQRILILQQCFTDPSELVRRNAQEKLIPVWFRACDDKLCNFFKYLRIENECLDNLPFTKELTKILSKCVKISQLFEEIEIDTNSYLPKLPLSGEKVFLWHHFFNYASKDERLSKFIPPLDTLIPFILKCFDDTSSEEVEISVFIELILFLMDIMETLGIRKCEDVFPMTLNLMRHPFVPHDIMPYLVVLYLNYSPKEKEKVLEDIVQVIEDLQKLLHFTEGQELNILRKCFAIASQVLTAENSLTVGVKNIKDNLIIHHLSSENPELKIRAISALALYCLLDLKEAKLSWPLFANAIHMESSLLKNILLESVFDILKCHGPKMFSDLESDGQEKFDETLLEMLKCLEDPSYCSLSEIVVRGTLKLFVEHHTLSPKVLANLIIHLLSSEVYTSTQHDFEKFLPVFGETKEGADCIIKTFLATINLAFDAHKNTPIHKLDIKKITLQLLEFSKIAEKQLSDYAEEKFQDLLVVKLTKKFLKKPWRLTALNLYNICCRIIPKKFDTLFKLKENIIQIIESLQTSVFQQKNPYAKKNIKNFSGYLKKIQAAMNKTPVENTSKNINSPSAVQKKLDFNSFSSKENSLQDDTDNPIISIDDISPIKETSEPKLDISSPIGSDVFDGNSKSLDKSIVTPRKIATPSQIFRTPNIKDTSMQDNIKFKTPAPPKPLEDESMFKTPKTRKTPSRKRQLDVTLTKTA